MVKKAISIFAIVEFSILLLYFYSSTIFANVEVAFLSSFFVILGSSFAYGKMVNSKVKNDEYEDKRDLLDEIEDPHELYDDTEINLTPADELDLKQIVKDEKSKIKTFSFNSIKHGVKGSLSIFRILPYIFLALGFIALKNNNILELIYYLPSLSIGIVVGAFFSKDVVN